MSNTDFRSNIKIGDKYYTYEGEDLVIGRVCAIRNADKFTLQFKDKDYSNVKNINLSKDELESKYTKLKPDGYIIFNVVKTQEEYKDILVMLFRREDLDNRDSVPYAICRQNIYDIFANQVKQKDNDNIYIGVSMSKNTIPEDVSYEAVLACNGLDHSITVSIYLDDKLEDFLGLFKHERYDNEIKIIGKNIQNPHIKGCCSSLRELLKSNKFMYDFHSAFNILELDFDLMIDQTYEIHPEQRLVVENMTKCEMFKTYVIKYDKSINLKDIKRDYILVSDKWGDIYILAYDKGEYINRHYRDEIKDKRDAAVMINNMKKNKI